MGFYDWHNNKKNSKTWLSDEKMVGGGISVYEECGHETAMKESKLM